MAEPVKIETLADKFLNKALNDYFMSAAKKGTGKQYRLDEVIQLSKAKRKKIKNSIRAIDAYGNISYIPVSHSFVSGFISALLRYYGFKEKDGVFVNIEAISKGYIVYDTPMKSQIACSVVEVNYRNFVEEYKEFVKNYS